MAPIPDKYLDLLQPKKAFANLATVMADGSPQVTPVWFDHHDGVIRVNTAKGRVKSRMLRQGAPGVGHGRQIRESHTPLAWAILAQRQGISCFEPGFRARSCSRS